MTALKMWTTAFAALAPVLVSSGCFSTGKVEQGRVIAYDRQTKRATLIRELGPGDRSGPGVLPPVTIQAPEDPAEMGPEPAAGKLMLVDAKARRMVIYDGALQAFRTIAYAPVEEGRNVTKAPVSPVVDQLRKTITVQSAADRMLITFAASDELLALPPDTWKCGDVVRYYYKDPGRARRLMNVTKTDFFRKE